MRLFAERRRRMRLHLACGRGLHHRNGRREVRSRALSRRGELLTVHRVCPYGLMGMMCVPASVLVVLVVLGFEVSGRVERRAVARLAAHARLSVETGLTVGTHLTAAAAAAATTTAPAPAASRAGATVLAVRPLSRFWTVTRRHRLGRRSFSMAALTTLSVGLRASRTPLASALSPAIPSVT